MNPFAKKKADEGSSDSTMVGEMPTAEAIEEVVAPDESGAVVSATATEDELKAEIKILERRIEKKQTHIDKLDNELGEMREELTTLKTQRIELLRRELES